MNEPVIVDAAGLSCPEPVILARQALADHPGVTVIVQVDSATSRDNVRRLGERQGCQVAVEGTAGGGYRLVLSR